MPTAEQLYRWHWRARLPERHGELLRVLVRGRSMNSCLVEFLTDGWRVVTSRNALRKARPMRTDFENLGDGDRVVLHPNADNPLHRNPVNATFSGGYFYCDGSDPTAGPDYYFGDVRRYNTGFEIPA